MPNIIYFDLDECLVHSNISIPGRSVGKRTFIPIQKGEAYHCYKRPSAHRMIEACRAIAPVKILTSSLRNYALKINSAMELGFPEDDIIAFEDYLEEVHLAYGKRDYLVRAVNVDPNGFLIDNLPPSDFRTAAKMKFLGIKTHQTAIIREYPGGKDPEKFESLEWPAILESIKTCQN